MAYRFDSVALDGGLDFKTPASLVRPGHLRDALNYEIVDRTGYKRIDGIRRFDGSGYIQDDEVYYIRSNEASSVIPTQFRPYTLYTADRYGDTYPFGILFGAHQVSSTEKYLFFVGINKKYFPVAGDIVYAKETTPGTSVDFKNIQYAPRKWTDAATFSPTDWLGTSGATGKPVIAVNEAVDSPRNLASYIQRWGSGFYTNHSSYACGPQMLRAANASDVVYAAPPPIVGVHYHYDYALAVTDPLRMLITNLNFADQLYPGDTVTLEDGVSGIVVYSELLQGAWNGASTGDIAVMWYIQTSRDTQSSSAYRRFSRNGMFPISVSEKDGFVSRLGTSTAAFTTLSGVSDSQVVGSLDYLSNYVAAPNSCAILQKSWTEETSMKSGRIVAVTLSGTSAGTATTPPAVSFSGSGGTGATGYATINSSGKVDAVYMITEGRGYPSNTTVSFDFTNCGGASGIGTLVATVVLADWSDCGWQPYNTGWQVSFTGGNYPAPNIPKINRSNNITSQIAPGADADTGAESPKLVLTSLDTQGGSLYNWIPSTGNSYASSLVSSADSDGVQLKLDGAFTTTTINSGHIGFCAFDFADIPDYAIITGVEVVATADTSASFGAVPSYHQLTAYLFVSDNPDAAPLDRQERKLGDELSKSFGTTNPLSNTSLTFGGNGVLWGNTNLTWDVVKQRGFGVAVWLALAGGGTYTLDWRLDTISMKIYYKIASPTYYFVDGTGATDNIIEAQLVDVALTSGNFQEGTATGTFQLANVRVYQAGTTPKHNIRSGWDMYADDGLTTKVADISSNMSYNGLDTREQIDEVESYYQMISANFYGNEDWQAVYGVTGAGRAFSFDGNYFQRIFAIPLDVTDSVSKDKPRSLAVHRFRLALGYPSGSVLFSRQGDPTNFDGLQGAVEVGIGDRITGLAPLQGQYIAVFGQNTIHGLQGDDLQLTTLSASSGALEYSIVPIGNRVIYCSHQGIRFLDPSDKYGDFEGATLSTKIAPWLRPRLNKQDGSFSDRTSSCLLFAFPCRVKNQVRYWFKDGYQLVMTLVGGEEEPQFTLSKYYFNVALPSVAGDWSQAVCHTLDDTDTGLYLFDGWVPGCYSSNIKEDGTEIMLFAPDVKKAFITDQSWVQEQESVYTDAIDPRNYLPNGVFEMDKGWAMDDYRRWYPIPAYITTTHYWMDNPYQVHTIRKVRIEGAHKNLASLTMTTAKDYNDPIVTSTSVGSPGNLTIKTSGEIAEDYKSGSAMFNVAETDRVVTIRVDNCLYEDKGVTSNIPSQPLIMEPPHYLQLMLTQFQGGKADA